MQRVPLSFAPPSPRNLVSGSSCLQRKRQLVMDGPGSIGPDLVPYSATVPSSRSGSFVAPPASAGFGGLTHPLAGGGLVGGTQASGEVPNNGGDFAMTLASPGSGPGVVIRSASRSDSGALSGQPSYPLAADPVPGT